MFCVFTMAIFLLYLELSKSASTASGVEFLISTHGFVSKSNWKNDQQKICFHISAEYTTGLVLVSVRSERATMTNNINRDVNFTQTAEYLVDINYIPDHISGIPSVFYITSSSPVNIFVTIHDIEEVRKFGRVTWDHKVIESFRAVPVSGWGRRYHVVTFGYRYSLILMTDDNLNNVTVTFNTKGNTGFNYTRNGVVYRNGQSIKVELLRLKAFVISTCDNTMCAGSLTGSTVVADGPIGVITGNCRSPNDNMKCTRSESTDENYMIEMLMPQETYGKEFILFKELGRIKGGYGIIVAGSNNTRLDRYIIKQTREENTLEVKTTTLNDVNDWFMFDGHVEYINSSKGILLMYVQRIDDLSTSGITGGPSLLQIVPIELFYFKYIIMSPPFYMTTTDYIVYIVERLMLRDILIKHQNSTTAGRNVQPVGRLVLEVLGNSKWIVVFETMEKGSKFIVVSPKSVFGCYQYGIDNEASLSYMHTAGFISSYINKHIVQCEQTRSLMNPLDLIDNDCDGHVDEELNNGIDDDNDGSIDEDINAFNEFNGSHDSAMQALPSLLKPLPPTATTMSDLTKTNTLMTSAPVNNTLMTSAPVNNTMMSSEPVNNQTTDSTVNATTNVTTSQTTHSTSLRPTSTVRSTVDKSFQRGPWSEWQCSNVCGDSFLHRKRSCTDDKLRFIDECDTETKAGHCYAGITCPGACPPYTWGQSCERSCVNCEDHCDRLDGSCSSCKSGYKNPLRSCEVECDMYHYGENCRGNCMDKCGEPCREPIYGDCTEETPYWKIVMIVLVIILPLMVTGYLLIRKRRNVNDMDSSVEDSYIKTSTTELVGMKTTLTDLDGHKKVSSELDGTSVDLITRSSTSLHSKPSKITKSSVSGRMIKI